MTFWTDGFLALSVLISLNCDSRAEWQEEITFLMDRSLLLPCPDWRYTCPFQYKTILHTFQYLSNGPVSLQICRREDGWLYLSYRTTACNLVPRAWIDFASSLSQDRSYSALRGSWCVDNGRSAQQTRRFPPQTAYRPLLSPTCQNFNTSEKGLSTAWCSCLSSSSFSLLSRTFDMKHSVCFTKQVESLFSFKHMPTLSLRPCLW